MAKRRREDLTEEEIRRIRARKKRKRQLKRRRQFYAVLLLLFLILIGIFLFRNRRDKEKQNSTVSDNQITTALPGAGAADSTESIGSGMVGDGNTALADTKSADDMSTETFYGSFGDDTQGALARNAAAPMDVTKGQAGIDLTAVSGNNVNKVQAAKQTMAGQAYFAGCNQTVNAYLNGYGEGQWHAIPGDPGEVCVFYDGKHIERESYEGEDGSTLTRIKSETPFKITFTMYEDGSFIVVEASEGGARVDDYQSFIQRIIGAE